jgi:hypothetical protein
VGRLIGNGQSTIRIELDIESPADAGRVPANRPKDARLVPLAQDVAIDRATTVCEVMFHIAAIRSLQQTGDRGANALVECVKAHLQDRTAQDGHQAAHLLPGQIKVANRPVWELASVPGVNVTAGDLVRLEARAQSCFALTWVLPAVFNRADSQAERMAGNDGLKKLFGDAVHLMWRTARTDPAQPLVIDRHAVITALQGWFSAVNSCYDRAADRKLLAYQTAVVNSGGTADNRHREMRILATYADSLLVANPARFISAHAPYLDSMYRFL